MYNSMSAEGQTIAILSAVVQGFTEQKTSPTEQTNHNKL